MLGQTSHIPYGVCCSGAKKSTKVRSKPELFARMLRARKSRDIDTIRYGPIHSNHDRDWIIDQRSEPLLSLIPAVIY